VKLVWNGNAMQGTQQIMEYLLDLPQTSHLVSGMDAQFLLGEFLAFLGGRG